MVHRALQCYDIIHEIMAWLPKSYGDLPRSARVCKGLLGPALDALWRDLTDLSVLFELIPGFWNDAMGLYILDTPPHLHDLERFNFYAPRIRSVMFSQLSTPVDPGSLSAIIRVNGGGALLPGLQHLYWGNISTPLAQEVLWLAPPSLRSLAVEVKGWDNMIEGLPELLAALLARLPKLGELSDYVFTTPQCPLVHVERLRKAYLGAVGLLPARSLLRSLFKAENLTHLQLALMVDSNDSAMDICDLNEGMFPAVKFFDIRASFIHTSQFLATTSSCAAVEGLYMKVDGHGSFQHSDILLSTLKRQVGMWSSTLTEVQITLTHIFLDSLPAGAPSLMDFAGPILPLRALKVVEISLMDQTPAMAITTEDVRAMSEAWPRIQELNISGAWHEGIPLPAIVDTAVRCPSLHTLVLPMKFTGDQLLALESRTAVAGPHILVLDLWSARFMNMNTRGEQMARLGELLDRFFPLLDIPKSMVFNLKPGHPTFPDRRQMMELDSLERCIEYARRTRLHGDAAPHA